MVYVVLGCPRSGTSLLTKVLVDSGLKIITDDLMKPNIHFNPDGYFENINIIKINDQIIRLKNKNNNYNFLNLPINPIEEENFSLLSNNNYSEFDNNQKITNKINLIKSKLTSKHVIKDSRLAFTLDDWGFEEIIIIKIKRNKEDVKKSLIKHYGNIFEKESKYMNNIIPKIDFTEFYEYYDSCIDKLLNKHKGVEINYEDLVNWDTNSLDKLGIEIFTPSIKKICNWCSFSTECIYQVPSSRIGAKIMYCKRCQLIQSYYTNIENKHRYKSISCDSDWGNIRHGKGVRLDASIDILSNLEINNILDIGSNRGNFCNWASKHFKSIEIDMIEPDNNICDYNFKFNNLFNVRFENFNNNKKYDLVYCCHTLEHIDNLHEFFKKVYIYCDKYLFIDVPNVKVLEHKDNIEEFFIDKHTYHFSENVLIKMLNYYGFEILKNNTDDFNIVLLSGKTNNKFLLNDYQQILKLNRNNLINKADKINKLFTIKKTVIYGATRIYDALIKYGNLNYKDAYYVVDDFSPLDNIYKSEKIKNDKPDLIIILARSSIDKIKKKIPTGIDVITFQEL